VWPDEPPPDNTADLELRQFIERLKRTTEALEAALDEAKRLDDEPPSGIGRVA
jgi:hypothetical protein